MISVNLNLFLRWTDTIVPMWDWYDQSQVPMARLFPNDTGAIVPAETWTIVSNWFWHYCSQVDFSFLIYLLLWFFTNKLYLGRILPWLLNVCSYKFEWFTIDVRCNIWKLVRHHNPVIQRYSIKVVCSCSYRKLVQ